MTAQLTRTPDLLHLSRPDVPPALSQLVQRCLARDQEKRPVYARSVQTDLDKISGAIAVIAIVGSGVWYSKHEVPPPAPGRVDTLTVLAPRDTEWGASPGASGEATHPR